MLSCRLFFHDAISQPPRLSVGHPNQVDQGSAQTQRAVPSFCRFASRVAFLFSVRFSRCSDSSAVCCRSPLTAHVTPQSLTCGLVRQYFLAYPLSSNSWKNVTMPTRADRSLTPVNHHSLTTSSWHVRWRLFAKGAQSESLLPVTSSIPGRCGSAFQAPPSRLVLHLFCLQAGIRFDAGGYVSES